MRKSKIRIMIILSIILFFMGSIYVTVNMGMEEFETNTVLKHPEDNICNMLYLNGESLEYTVIKNFLTDEFCDDFLDYSKQYAKANGWTKKRHVNYPTTDNSITEGWPQHEFITSVVRTKIFDAISKMYPVLVEDLGIIEMFVVKYEPSKQSFLKEHKDGSEFSFVIALNDDYEGGGTYFPNLKELVKLNKGDVLIFSGQNTHKGEPVIEGSRYILTGFIFYKEKDYCE